MTAERSRLVAAAVALTLVALAVRAAGAVGAPWIDEILSMGLAVSARSFADVLFRLHHDNNHLLNTLWLRCVGDAAPAVLWRLPAIAAGGAAVAMAVAWRARAGRAEALVAGALVACSALLVEYGSEARGHGIALAFTLSAPLLLRAGSSASWTRAAAWWLVALLGLLAQLTFAFVVLGAAGAAAWRALRQRRAREAAAALRVHAVPLATTALLWLGFARDMTIAGGGPNPGAWSIVVALSRLVGGPIEGRMVAPVAVAVAVASLLGLAIMARREADDAALVAGCAVVAPVVLILVTRPQYLLPRYVLLPCALLAAPLAAATAHALARPRLRVAGASAIAAALSLCLVADARLAVLGRGDGRAALRLVHDASREPADSGPTTVGADNDFRLRMLAWLDRRELSQPPELALVTGGQGALAPPHWLVGEEFSTRASPPATRAAGGAVYRLVATFPHAGLSGITWVVYRRDDLAAPWPRPPG